MTISMYELTVPVLARGLRILSSYLNHAETFAAERNIAPSILINARLAPDMMSFAAQIQRASDTSKAAIGRLTGLPTPSFADTETSFEDLRERVDQTIAFLQSASETDFTNSESRNIELKFRFVSADLDGKSYVVNFLLPNFFFHITTAHDIVHKNILRALRAATSCSGITSTSLLGCRAELAAGTLVSILPEWKIDIQSISRSISIRTSSKAFYL